MFRELMLMIVFLPSLVVAQNNLSGAKREPLATPAGKPLGDIATTKIDSKGGYLKSKDGKLEVIFPADALDTETLISIQAIYNELTEDDSDSYQLEPSGLTFKKPVQLIFHYADVSESTDLMSIGWQDDKGQWHQAKNIVIDTVQKSITISTTHFSNWARFDKLYIIPRSATVKVNKTVRLIVAKLETLTFSSGSGGSGDDELATPQPLKSGEDELAAPEGPLSFYTSDWTVNSIINGDVEVGTLKLVEAKNSWGATYKAPPTVPSGNPVAVSVQIYSNKKNKKLLLTSNITVVGEQYRFTYKHFDNSGVFHVIDSSSCIINMEKEKVRISDIINYKPWADGNPGGLCKGAKWTNPDSFKGLIEITGMISSRVTPPASEGGLPNVYIIFSPALGNTPSFSCKEGGGVPSMPQPALPKDINFDIDGDDVIIHAGGKTGRNQLIMESKNEKNIIAIHKL